MTDSSLSSQIAAPARTTELPPAAPAEYPGSSIAANLHEASAQFASEYLAGQSQNAGGAKGLERAASVLAGGLADGLVDSAKNSLNWHTAETAVESLGLGYGLGALAKAGPIGQKLAMAGGLVMAGTWAYSEIERGRPQATVQAVADAYNSNEHTVQDRQIVATTGGALAFDTILAAAAGGLGMKKGLELNNGWHVDALAGAKSTYGRAIDFLASDGRAHGAHVLGQGDMGMAFAGKDAIVPGTAGDLPGFSQGTMKILAVDNQPLAARVNGHEYSSSGLPVQHDYHPSGVKPLVPFDQAAQILDPAAFKPKSVTNFKDLNDIFNAQNRAQLGQSDAIASQLRANIADGAAQGKSVVEEGQRLQALQNEQLKKHGPLGAEELKGRAHDVVVAEQQLADIEAQAKAITSLRLESARITVKLNRLDANGGAEATGADQPGIQLKTHLKQQQELLQSEIARRNEQVGSVKDPESPIAKAREALRVANIEASDWFVFNDRTARPSGLSFDESRSYYDNQPKAVVGTERAIQANIDAQKETAVKYSESVYAYNARLDALQHPERTTAAPNSVVAAGEARAVAPTVRPAPRIEELAGTRPARQLERPAAAPEVKTPPFDAKAEAANLVKGSLRSDLRERVGSRLSTQTLQQEGALDRAVDRVYNQSTIALFKDGKPVSVTGNDQRPHMALLDIRNFDQRLAQVSDVNANGFAVLSPVVEADGSMAVLRQQPISSGRGTRPVFKKEVVAVAGKVPHGVEEGTSFGKLFGLFAKTQG